jgi:hypothetical protein
VNRLEQSHRGSYNSGRLDFLFQFLIKQKVKDEKTKRETEKDWAGGEKQKKAIPRIAFCILCCDN